MKGLKWPSSKLAIFYHYILSSLYDNSIPLKLTHFTVNTFLNQLMLKIYDTFDNFGIKNYFEKYLKMYCL